MSEPRFGPGARQVLSCTCGAHPLTNSHQTNCPLFPGSRNDERAEIARDPFFKAISETLSQATSNQSMTKPTKQDCLDAIAKLVLGDRAEWQTNRIDPEPDTTYVSFFPEVGLGTMAFSCKLQLNEAHGLVHCVVDAGSIKIVCRPQTLQDAYDYVKTWMLR